MKIIYKEVKNKKDIKKVKKIIKKIFGKEEIKNFLCWLYSSKLKTKKRGLSSILYGAYVDKKLIGIGAAMENPACEYVVSLGWLGVLKKYRNLGIAKKILKLRAKWAYKTRPNKNFDRILELSCYNKLENLHYKNGFVVTCRHKPNISCIMQAKASEILKREFENRRML